MLAATSDSAAAAGDPAEQAVPSAPTHPAPGRHRAPHGPVAALVKLIGLALVLAGLVLPTGGSTAGASTAPVITAGKPRLTEIVQWVNWAATQNIPYVYAGGHGDQPGPSMGGVDCSGFARWAYSQVGWDIGSGSGESMRTSGLFEQTARPVPGDLVFFAYPGGPAYHVGVYIGTDSSGAPLMVDAPYTGVDVRVDHIRSNVMGYWHIKAATAADSGPLTRIGPTSTAPAPAIVVVEGDFVRRPGSAEVYRVVGNAPVYVAHWSVFGGAQPVKAISATQWARLNTYPADGAFLSDRYTGAVYRMAGGAPVYVARWAVFGGARPTVAVDPAALANAGGAGVWGHLRAHPVDGTLLTSGQTGVTYVVAGGAPLAFAAANHVPAGPQTVVDDVALTRAGGAGVLRFLSYRPADGTFIRAYRTTKVYRVVDGRAVYVPSWVPYGGPQPVVGVDGAVFAWAGRTAPWDHLLGVTG